MADTVFMLQVLNKKGKRYKPPRYFFGPEKTRTKGKQKAVVEPLGFLQGPWMLRSWDSAYALTKQYDFGGRSIHISRADIV